MKDEELIKSLESKGYHGVRHIEGRGLCGVREFIFTVGLCYGLDEVGYKGRWCYPKDIYVDAILAFKVWDGKGDPIGRWVKYKGRDREYGNNKLTGEESNIT